MDQSTFTFLYGKCLFHEYSDPYLPFIDALKGYLEEKGPKSEGQKPTSEQVCVEPQEETMIPLSVGLIPLQMDEKEHGISSESAPEEASEEENFAAKLMPLGLIPMGAEEEEEKEISEPHGLFQFGATGIDIEKEQDKLFDVIFQYIYDITLKNPAILLSLFLQAA